MSKVRILTYRGMPKLKPCPHCGGKIYLEARDTSTIADFHNVAATDLLYEVTPTCTKCGTKYPSVSMKDIREDIKNAIMARILREWVL